MLNQTKFVKLIVSLQLMWMHQIITLRLVISYKDFPLCFYIVIIFCNIERERLCKGTFVLGKFLDYINIGMAINKKADERFTELWNA